MIKKASYNLLAFYPLVDDSQIFRELDGWLLNVLGRAQKERIRLLKKYNLVYKPYTKDELITGSWYDNHEIKVETQLPSFYKSWLYIKNCRNTCKLKDFPSPQYSDSPDHSNYLIENVKEQKIKVKNQNGVSMYT